MSLQRESDFMPKLFDDYTFSKVEGERSGFALRHYHQRSLVTGEISIGEIYCRTSDVFYRIIHELNMSSENFKYY